MRTARENIPRCLFIESSQSEIPGLKFRLPQSRQSGKLLLKRKLFCRQAHSLKTPGMDDHTILDQLEELLEKFGVRIRHEAIRQDEDAIHITGGLCLLRGEYVLILNSKATIKDRIWTLGIALKQFDYDQIYIRPVLRDILEKIPEPRRLTVSGNRGLKI